MRVFAVSDIHTDFEPNLQWCKDIDSRKFKQDVCICAGDVSDRLSRTELTLKILKEKFGYVFYVFGNHDVWVDAGINSIQKINEIMAVCEAAGVFTSFAMIEEILFVPLPCWYYFDFEEQKTEMKEYNLESLNRWQDFHRCNWPLPTNEKSGDFIQKSLYQCRTISEYFSEQHESLVEKVAALKEKPKKVITFSHFLPRADLNPVKELVWKELVLVSSCAKLDTILRRLGSSLHIFGHTHIPTEKHIDSVLYIQNPLGYPDEPWIAHRDIDRMQVWPQKGSK